MLVQDAKHLTSECRRNFSVILQYSNPSVYKLNSFVRRYL